MSEIVFAAGTSTERTSKKLAVGVFFYDTTLGRWFSGDGSTLGGRYVSNELISQVEAEGGAATDPKLWSALRVRQALLEFANTYGTTEDLRFPVTAVNPPGLTTDPPWDSTLMGYLFAGTGTIIMMLQCIAQLSHHYLAGTGVFPHVHWTKTTSASGNVEWILEYKWAPINQVIDAAWTTLTANTTIAATPDTDTADKVLITSFGEISGTGRDISDILLMRLSRDPAAVNDTYGADARLLEIDLHCTHRLLGEDI